jgi:DMSO/TMAO reductase YedYZ molybdopterin-dependent catalytic subunit
VNGLPPTSEQYRQDEAARFCDWRLDVGGLVERPLCLSLDDLNAMAQQRRVTRHHCIQGWSAVAAWSGVQVSDLMRLCGPLPDTRYVNFVSLQEDAPGRPYHETLDLELAARQETIVALEMNGAPLSPEHGAPLRLRVETQLGFKMVKWLCRIEFIHDLSDADPVARGGTREDTMNYERVAPI